MICEMCRDTRWLPIDREEDHDEIEGEMLMLFPTQFVPCPRCNELAMLSCDVQQLVHRNCSPLLER